MKFRRIHWARIALLGIAFVTFRAAEAQVANETVVVMTPAPQYAVPPVPPLQSALEYALQPERITVPIVFVPAPVPLPKPKPFILPPELDSYPPDLMARARRRHSLAAG